MRANDEAEELSNLLCPFCVALHREFCAVLQPTSDEDDEGEHMYCPLCDITIFVVND